MTAQSLLDTCYGSVRMRTTRSSILLLFAFAACTKPSNDPQPVPPEPREEPLPRCASGIRPLPPRIQRGVCLAHNYQGAGHKGYGSKTGERTLRELQDVGVQWVSLTPFGFMTRLDEAKVHPIGDYRAGETDDRMVQVIAQAKALGMQVMLKPHIWVVDGAWRGQIDFAAEADWQRWFDDYERWMLGYADMAEAQGVDNLVIGVELRSTETKLEPRWRRLIRQIRKRYRGKLTYAANWDDAAAMPWWDAVDYIGIQFYPPLAAKPGVGRAEVTRTLRARIDEVQALATKAGKPVIFTEVGFRSASDGLVHPHAWPERSERLHIDAKTQALGYAAFIDTIRERPWAAGVYWWKWFTDPDTTEEGPAGFSPRAKRAESILRAAYAGNCTETKPTP